MRKAIGKINEYLYFVSAFLILVLLFMTLAEVIMRKFFNMPMLGVYELTMVFLSIIIFFSTGYAQENKYHVVIDYFYDKFPHIGKRIISIISTVIYTATVGAMFWTVTQNAMRQLAAGTTTPITKVPLYPVIFLSALGLAGLTLAVLTTLYHVTVEKGVLSHDSR